MGTPGTGDTGRTLTSTVAARGAPGRGWPPGQAGVAVASVLLQELRGFGKQELEPQRPGPPHAPTTARTPARRAGRLHDLHVQAESSSRLWTVHWTKGRPHRPRASAHPGLTGRASPSTEAAVSPHCPRVPGSATELPSLSTRRPGSGRSARPQPGVPGWEGPVLGALPEGHSQCHGAQGAGGRGACDRQVLGAETFPSHVLRPIALSHR